MNTNMCATTKKFYSLNYSQTPPQCYIDNINDVTFVESLNTYRVKPRFIKDGKIMVFVKPIWYNDDFRLIPCYISCVINELGDVYSLKSNKLLKQYDSNGYIHVSIGDYSVPLHRLLGLAWIKNPDWSKCHVINHLDGVKHNNKLENLEWCTNSHNSKHAARTGLTVGTTSAKVRDFNTGEITRFNTLGELSEFLGANQTIPSQRFIDRDVATLSNGRYEVRVDGDDRPWYYIDGKPLTKRANGVIEEIEVLHVTSNAVTIHDSIRAASKDLDIGYGIIHRAINFNDGRVINDRVYRKLTHGPWTIKHDYKVQPIAIEAKCGDKIKRFKSLKSTAKFLNCDRTKIKTHIRDSKPINGWLLSYIE